MSNNSRKTARLASRPQDFQMSGLAERDIAQWEDGQRAKTGRGHYEWWYFDAHLDDGTTVVIVFYTKPLPKMTGPFDPFVTVHITFPDGRTVIREQHFRPDQFHASTESCDVRIGDNRFVGNLDTYRITLAIEDVSVDVELKSIVPSWRPATGHMYFGNDSKEHLFAWLPSIPEGSVSMNYTIAGKKHVGKGVGYHDHNWGDAPMTKLINDWYWARAKIGPYTVIASCITASKQFGFDPITVFLLSRDGEIVSDAGNAVKFSTDRVQTDAKTGKPLADLTTYEISVDDERYVIRFERTQTILSAPFVDTLPALQRFVAKLLRIDSAYVRVTGNASIERLRGGQVIESHQDPAIWEMMYFGQARPPAA